MHSENAPSKKDGKTLFDRFVDAAIIFFFILYIIVWIILLV
ncbi:hypothetical protein BMS3Abin16_00515 [archaeon BMS3Abin16]|nr:hypothetical protein BMS3Abin16_00515 [archaeon BMS3Abin16]